MSSTVKIYFYKNEGGKVKSSENKEKERLNRTDLENHVTIHLFLARKIVYLLKMKLMDYCV